MCGFGGGRPLRVRAVATFLRVFQPPDLFYQTKSYGVTTAPGSTVRRGGYLVAALIHKTPAGLSPRLIPGSRQSLSELRGRIVFDCRIANNPAMISSLHSKRDFVAVKKSRKTKEQIVTALRRFAFVAFPCRSYSGKAEARTFMKSGSPPLNTFPACCCWGSLLKNFP
jgi:hypothetical protein